MDVYTAPIYSLIALQKNVPAPSWLPRSAVPAGAGSGASLQVSMNDARAQNNAYKTCILC